MDQIDGFLVCIKVDFTMRLSNWTSKQVTVDDDRTRVSVCCPKFVEKSMEQVLRRLLAIDAVLGVAVAGRQRPAVEQAQVGA